MKTEIHSRIGPETSKYYPTDHFPIQTLLLDRAGDIFMRIGGKELIYIYEKELTRSTVATWDGDDFRLASVGTKIVIEVEE